MDTENSGFRGRHLLALVAIGLTTGLLSSCPVPFDTSVLHRVKDELGPVISVTTPVDGSACANIVEVTGAVVDSATEAGADGGVSSMSYEVLGAAVEGDITLTAGGAFEFEFSSVALGETFSLAITATDWNENTSTLVLTLHRESGNGIPSFVVTPTNKSVTLEWEDLPHTTSYAVRYTTNGALPSETVGIELSDVTSPLDITGLQNGYTHVFQLIAEPETTWPESESGYVQAVPLSDQDLAPRATGMVEGIRVEWRPIEATDTYEVWRSTSIDGTYVNLSGPIDASEFIDTDAAEETSYFYKVRPADYGNGLSSAGGAKRDAFSIHDPYVVSELDTPGLGYRVKVFGDYAYIADVTEGLQIVDMSDPENPSIVGSCLTADRAFDIVVSGDYAFVADATAGLTVVHIADKTSPAVVTTIDTPNFAVTVSLSGGYVYVADNTTVQIFDISTPTAPTIDGFEAVVASAAIVEGDYLYVVAGDEVDDFLVFALTGSGTATDPFPQGTLDAGLGFTWGMAIQGNYAYVADRGLGLVVIDVTLPGSPSVAGGCSTPGGPYDVVVDGPYAFVADESGGMHVINVSDPSSVDDQSIISSKATQSHGGGLGIARDGNYVYMAEWEHGLTVLKASVPATPAIVGTLSGLSTPAAVSVHGDMAYVSDGIDGIRIVDVSNPASPTLLNTVGISGDTAIDADVVGRFVIAGDNVHILDIADPATASEAGTCSTNGGTWSVALFGPYLYTSNTHVGMNIVDITDPYAPEITSLRNTSGTVMDVAISGSVAFVADGPVGTIAMDVSDPSQAVTISAAALPLGGRQANALALSGDILYVLETDADPFYPGDPPPIHTITGKLRQADVSNPAGPAFDPPALDVSLDAQEITSSGSFVFVVDLTGGLEIIDTSQSMSSFSLATLSIPDATDIAVAGRYAYITVADTPGELVVVDLLAEM